MLEETRKSYVQLKDGRSVQEAWNEISNVVPYSLMEDLDLLAIVVWLHYIDIAFAFFDWCSKKGARLRLWLWKTTTHTHLC